MQVAVCRITLRIATSNSLKDKRQVVRSLSARIQNQFNVSIAEVDDNDVWRTAVLGLACVSNNATLAGQVLDSVVQFIERTRPDVEVVECESETIPV